MPTLVIAKTFLPDYARLDKSVRTHVDELFAKFRTATHSGLHLEKYAGARDPRAKTIRVNQQYRGIVIVPEQGETYILTRVLNHDEADAWMARNTFSVNELTGALEVTDVVGIEGTTEAFQEVAAPTERSLFEGIKPAALKGLGIAETLAPVLAKMTSLAEVEALTQFLPDGQASVLESLALGATPEEAWAEVLENETADAVDTEDLAAAAARASSQSSFYVVQGEDELFEVINRPFELWRTFLHPNQRRYVAKDFNGPARITGGAGTGKTVVAMHRARELATRLCTTDSGGTEKVLFTTFTTTLADDLRDTMTTFCSPDVLSRIDIVNIDRIAYRIVNDATNRRPNPISSDELASHWEDVADELGTGFTKEFLQQEWEQVVLAQGIHSQAEYVTASRAGRGIRLDRRQRLAIWKAIEELGRRLVGMGKVTFLQMADLAAAHLDARTVKPYAHVVLDEAQDLHPAQWRMLRAAVAPGPNDLFIVGDTHQRIYDNRVSLSKLGIEVRGRSARLKINYRTTAEILNWSLRLLTGEPFDDLDEGTDSTAGYRSSLHGSNPELHGFSTPTEELKALVDSVRAWLDDGFEPGEIGIAARTKERLSQAEAALKDAGVPAQMLALTRDDDRVSLATMHRMKGMEFRAMAVIDAGANRVPLDVTQESVDALQHRNDLQRERCLVYVACTRARDTLRISWSGPPSPFVDPSGG